MKQYTPLIFSLGLCIASAVGYGYIFVDLQNNIGTLAVIKKEIQSVSVRDETAQSMTTLLSNIRTLKDGIQSYVVEDDGVVDTIELIEDVAQREGVTLSLSSVTAVEQDGWE